MEGTVHWWQFCYYRERASSSTPGKNGHSSSKAEEKFKKVKASNDPKMGIATLLSNPVSEMVQSLVAALWALQAAVNRRILRPTFR